MKKKIKQNKTKLKNKKQKNKIKATNFTTQRTVICLRHTSDVID